MEGRLGRQHSTSEKTVGGRRLRNAVFLLLLAAIVTSLHYRRSTGQLQNGPASDDCTFRMPPLIFDTYDSTVEQRVEEGLSRLPKRAVHILSAAGYKTIVLPDNAAVRGRYPGQHYGDISGYVNAYKREIVIENSLDAHTHELGHTVDYALGDLSLSKEFLSILPEHIEKKEIEAKEEGDKRRAMGGGLSSIDDRLAFLSTLQKRIGHPYPLNRAFIFFDNKLLFYVQHAFVDGFTAYYSENETERTGFAQNSPRFFTFFDNLDRNLRAACDENGKVVY